jgi:ClpP class serine protease
MTESLIGRIIGTPWVIHAPALQTIAEIAAREMPDPANLEAWKALLAPPNREAVAFRASADLPGARRAQLRDGVAIIPIAGPIFRRANLMTNFSGATALSDIAQDLQLAADDARVKAILLEVDSPGGHADGIAEVAQAIRAMRGRKPIAAYVDGMAGSAAYWLASAAETMVVAPTGVVGSLGAVAIFPPDKPGQPKALEIVSSQTPGKRANPHTDAGRAQLQALIDSLAGVFLADAAENRGISVDALLEATGGGGLVMGANAVSAGLADRVGGFEELLAQLAAGDRGGASGGATRPSRPPPAYQPTVNAEGPIMTETAPAPATVADQAPPAPQAAAAPPSPVADPVAAERARVSAILAGAKPPFAALAQVAVAQGWTADVFTQAQAAAEGAVTAGIAASAAAGFKASLPAAVPTAPADAPAPQTAEEKLQARWDGDAALRAEFGGKFSAFAAYEKAHAEGRLRAPRRAA